LGGGWGEGTICEFRGIHGAIGDVGFDVRLPGSIEWVPQSAKGLNPWLIAQVV